MEYIKRVITVKNVTIYLVIYNKEVVKIFLDEDVADGFISAANELTI